MSNKYIEKISHWINYLGSPSKASAKAAKTLERIKKVHLSNRNAQNKFYNNAPDYEKGLGNGTSAKSINDAFNNIPRNKTLHSRDEKLYNMRRKVNRDLEIGQNVTKGAPLVTAATTLGIYTKNKLSTKKE